MSLRAIFWIGLASIAYASRPDKDSFQRHIDKELSKSGTGYIERKVLSHMTAAMYKIDDYYLFSLVKVPTERMTFVGLFGIWIRIPV